MYFGTPSNVQYYVGQPVLPNGSGFSVFNYTALQQPVTKNTFWLGANYDFTPAVKGSVGYYQQNINATTNSSATTRAGKQNYISAMAEYYLSKRTNLYAAGTLAGYMGSSLVTSQATTGGATATTVNQQFTYGLGMRHTF